MRGESERRVRRTGIVSLGFQLHCSTEAAKEILLRVGICCEALRFIFSVSLAPSCWTAHCVMGAAAAGLPIARPCVRSVLPHLLRKSNTWHTS